MNKKKIIEGLNSIFTFVKVHKKISVVIVLVILFAGWRITSSSQKQPQYQTADAQKETLISTVSESGQVAVANRVAVTTGANGIVSHVYVKSGDTVSAGETIADLTLDIAGQQKQAAAWSSYLSAKNNLDSSNANLNSLQSKMFVSNQTFLNDQGSSANPSDQQKAAPKYIEENADWLAAEAAYKDQANVISQAQIAVNNALFAYDAVASNIIAPQDGTISDLTIAPGMQVGGAEVSGGTSGTALSTVANIKSGGTPTISVNLSEVDAAKVQTGQKATLTFDALPNQTFTGRVIGINTTGTVSSGVTSYPATIVLDTANDHILPNMSVTANIITGVKDNVLAVPTAAIQSSGGQSTVRVLKNGQITIAQVTTGATSDADTEIVSGLNEGDIVVVGFVPIATAGGSAAASPFSSSNPFRGIGGGGFGGGARGGGGGARGN
jgi:membrane fusion protein, macrolide-specific efflux system